MLLETAKILIDNKPPDRFMEHMDRVRKEIEDYIFENGKEYDRLLMSKSFYEKLKKEADENDYDVDLPNLEIKEHTNYDFKLLP